jgi:hypothetical protein
MVGSSIMFCFPATTEAEVKSPAEHRGSTGHMTVAGISVASIYVVKLMLELQKDWLCLGMQNIIVYKVHNKFLSGPLLFEVVNNFKHVFLLSVGCVEKITN